MKNLTQNAKNLLVVIDAYLDYFWVGIVLRGFHRKMSELYWKRAAYVQDVHIKNFRRVPREKLAKLRHQAQRHSLEAKLIKEMFV
jgi:hypothetical protein